MHRLKLVHVVGNLGFGGAERFVVDLCNEIAKNQSYEVAIIALCENREENPFIKDISGNVKYLTFGKKKGFSLSVLMRLTLWLKLRKPDVVHTHMNSSEYLTLYRLISWRTLFFHTIHNIAEVECPGSLLKSFRRLFYRYGKVIPVTISDNGRSTFRSYYGLDNDVLIENGRPPLKYSSELFQLAGQYRSDESSFLLVNVGRISAEKNQLLLIQAVKRFNALELKKCKLLIIGQVQDEQLYKQLLTEAGADQYIEFLGPRKNVADYLMLAHVFCLSSEFEGMPISLIESFEQGCVSLCTPVGGIPQMIEDGVTGFLSRDLTVEGYGDALKRAVSSDADQISGNVLREFREKYHIGISADKHLRAYVSLLPRTAGAGVPLFFHTSKN